MSEPWYDTKVFSVILGGIFGFLLSFIPARIVEKRKVKTLARALKVEIDTIVSQDTSLKRGFEKGLTRLEDGTLTPIFATGSERDLVYKGNTDSIGALPNYIVPNIVLFYMKIEQFRKLSIPLQQIINDHICGAGPAYINKDLVRRALNDAIALLADIIRIGEEVSPLLRYYCDN